MSNVVFTHPLGVQFGNLKIPNFNTQVQAAVSGKENRLGMMAYPLWTFSYSYEVLRSYGAFVELRTLGGFFLARRGMLDSFLYSDLEDNTVVDQNFGTGDGVKVAFQLKRSWGGFDEPVENVNVLTNIKKAGVAQTNPTNYSISATGLVTFTSAPANGAALTWTGTYYYRCRFLQDDSEYKQFLQNLWANGKLEFIGSTMNKV